VITKYCIKLEGSSKKQREELAAVLKENQQILYSQQGLCAAYYPYSYYSLSGDFWAGRKSINKTLNNVLTLEAFINKYRQNIISIEEAYCGDY